MRNCPNIPSTGTWLSGRELSRKTSGYPQVSTVASQERICAFSFRDLHKVRFGGRGAVSRKRPLRSFCYFIFNILFVCFALYLFRISTWVKSSFLAYEKRAE